MFLRACCVLCVALLLHSPSEASRGTQWAYYCRNINKSLVEEVWRKGKDKRGKGKFHCTFEIKVRRGVRREAMRENY